MSDILTIAMDFLISQDSEILKLPIDQKKNLIARVKQTMDQMPEAQLRALELCKNVPASSTTLDMLDQDAKSIGLADVQTLLTESYLAEKRLKKSFIRIKKSLKL
jgi:hypothetical protein